MKHDYAHVIPGKNDPSVKGKALIIFKGKNKCGKYDDTGKLVETEEDVYMPFPVESVDDLSHVEYMRKAHGYSVVGIELLENMKNQVVAKNIAAQVALILRAPEATAQIAEKDAEIEALKAQLAAVQAPVADPVVEAKPAKAKEK